MADRYDVIVIGGGIAGHAAALRAAELGARVALVEKAELGGTCLNRGCIPTKAWLSAVGLLRELRSAARLGIRVGDCSLDLPVARRRVREVVDQLRAGMARSFEEAGVRVLQGAARLRGAEAQGVEVWAVGEETRELLRGRAAIVATGSLPALPPIPGLEEPGVAAAEECLDIAEVPPRVCILGGGTIGVEMATLYAGLGSQVMVLEIQEKLVPGLDPELAQLLRTALEMQGIQVLTSARVGRVTAGEAGTIWRVRVESPGGSRVIEVEKVIVAAGRRPNTEGLGLEGVGIRQERGGWVAVDERLRTSLPSVFAAGDVTGKLLLAHVGARQGVVAAENALGGDSVIDYRAIPCCIYTYPEIAWVGMSPEEARRRGYAVKVGQASFGGNGRALAAGQADGWVRVIWEERYGEILGVEMIGPHVTELIAEAVAVMQLEGTVQEWARAVHGHPTLSEVVGEALRSSRGGQRPANGREDGPTL